MPSDYKVSISPVNSVSTALTSSVNYLRRNTNEQRKNNIHRQINLQILHKATSYCLRHGSVSNRLWYHVNEASFTMPCSTEFLKCCWGCRYNVTHDSWPNDSESWYITYSVTTRWPAHIKQREPAYSTTQTKCNLRRFVYVLLNHDSWPSVLLMLEN